MENYPMNYCLCDKFKMRGGDDCSIFYCLNECTGHGSCEEGICKCDDDFYGVDCSVFVKSAISSAVFLLGEFGAVISLFILVIISF